MNLAAATEVSPAMLTVYIVAGTVGAVLFWMVVVWLIAWLGGWQRVAREFPGRRKPRGLELRWCSLSISPLANYNNCLRLILSGQGIYATPVWLFRFGHRPILLPWANVGPARELRFFGRRWQYLPVQAGRKTLKIQLPRKGWKWIEQNVKRA